jgi:hypothetical protein
MAFSTMPIGPKLPIPGDPGTDQKDGVKLEACIQAVKVMSVDRSTLLPEIDPLGNGFVSVIGSLMQICAVVRIP